MFVSADQEVLVHGVLIIGLRDLPGQVALDASQMYSNNITNLLLSYWDAEQKIFVVNLDDAILNACVVIHQGRIRSNEKERS